MVTDCLSLPIHPALGHTQPAPVPVLVPWQMLGNFSGCYINNECLKSLNACRQQLMQAFCPSVSKESMTTSRTN